MGSSIPRWAGVTSITGLARARIRRVQSGPGNSLGFYSSEYSRTSTHNNQRLRYRSISFSLSQQIQIEKPNFRIDLKRTWNEFSLKETFALKTAANLTERERTRRRGAGPRGQNGSLGSLNLRFFWVARVDGVSWLSGIWY